jgi:hypothetical protein
MKEEEEKEEKKMEKETEEKTSFLDENAEEEKIRFDDILKDLGDFGPYQKIIYFLLFLPTIFRQGRGVTVVVPGGRINVYNISFHILSINIHLYR